MKIFSTILWLLFCLTSCSKNKAQVPDTISDNDTIKPFFMKGIDVSFIPQLRAMNVPTYDSIGNTTDFLNIIQQSGINTIRLRILHTPAVKYYHLNEVSKFANELRSKGFKIYLTVHYSDSMCDPGKQPKPKAWQNLDFATLQDSLYNYTFTIAKTIQPNYMQVGNEINSGFMFPEGKLSNNENQFKTLVNKGISAIRAASPTTKILLHYAGHWRADSFYAKFKTADYDIMGLSYYPYWHGKSLTDLSNATNLLTYLYKKPIIIAETIYPFDSLKNTANFLVPNFSASPTGQAQFVTQVKNIIKQNNNGAGVCLWGGVLEAYTNTKPNANGWFWENQAVLNYKNQELPVLKAFGKN